MRDDSTPSLAVKTCARCDTAKPSNEFHRNRNSADGLNGYCKPCAIETARVWRTKNLEYARERDRSYRLANAEIRAQQNRAYYRANAERLIAEQRARQLALKDAAYEAYGGYRCVCCGETEPMFLCLDHVDGQGNEHRREIGGADRLYNWLKKNGYPEGLLQVLCFNCNQGKRLNGNVCPHQVKAIHGIDITEVAA